MKKVNINLSSTQPNFSVVIPVINPYFVGTNNSDSQQATVANIDWSNACPDYPKLTMPPSYPKIEEITTSSPNDDSTSLSSVDKPKLSITKEELLDKCQEEMKNCARSIKRIRESNLDSSTSDSEMEFKYKLLTVIHEQLEVINMVI